MSVHMIAEEGMNVSLCGNPKCNHDQQNHIKSICDGAIDCMCEQFVQPVLAAFAAEVEVCKAKRWTIYDRCKYILEKIAPTRNAGEKSFSKIYNEIWYGFKIRASGTSLTTEEWKRLPSADTVNREKRRVKEHHPHLATYSPEVARHQSAIWLALMEMATCDDREMRN